MEDSFKLRVEKAFGSLVQFLPQSVPSPWSLSDEEVERRTWNREENSPDRDEAPCSLLNRLSAQKEGGKTRLNGLLDEIDEEFADDANDEDTRWRRQLSDAEKEELEIRSSVGLDCTLDREEEEDEYDKLAIGREQYGERIYMRDVRDDKSRVDSHVFCDSLWDNEQRKADDIAAEDQLEETQAELIDSVGSYQPDGYTCGESGLSISKKTVDVKPILKRKGNLSDSKVKKRVRFNSEVQTSNMDEETAMSLQVSSTAGRATCIPDIENPNFVPDHVRNPQSYTHYTFDSVYDDDDDESNRQAYQKFRDTLVGSGSSVHDDISGPIVFTPKTKISTVKTQVDFGQSHSNVIGVAAAEQDIEACSSDEDMFDVQESTRNGHSRRSGRQYRSKASLDS